VTHILVIVVKFTPAGNMIVGLLYLASVCMGLHFLETNRNLFQSFSYTAVSFIRPIQLYSII